MAKKIMEDENNLKRQARRRLIGAAVLATVVVAVLPMLLDREPKSAVKDIELRIPDKDRAGGFVPNAALPAVPAAVLPASAPVADAPVSVSPLVAGAAVAAVAAPTPVVSHVSETPQQPVAKPAAVPVQASTAVSEAKAAPAKPEAKAIEAAHKEQAAQSSGFIVQIGAFSNVDTAHRWHKNLVKQNIKAYTEKAGDKIRVRAGPYVTREAAEKVRHRLESQGLHPNIVEID
jgi:DedD protein